MEKQSASNQAEGSSNHGEGDPAAAERFNVAEQAFVESARGKKAISDGTRVRADQEAELARSKGDDSTCLDGL